MKWAVEIAAVDTDLRTKLDAAFAKLRDDFANLDADDVKAFFAQGETFHLTLGAFVRKEPPAIRTRNLAVGGKTVQIADDLAEQWLAAGLVYECGMDEQHDLHLHPDADWPYQLVEDLVAEIVEGAATT